MESGRTLRSVEQAITVSFSFMDDLWREKAVKQNIVLLTMWQKNYPKVNNTAKIEKNTT